MDPYWTFSSLAERDAQDVHPVEVGNIGRVLEGAGAYYMAIRGGKGPACWGLGPVDLTQALSGYRLIGPVVHLTDAANIQTDASAGSMFSVTLHGNRHLANPTGLVPGGRYLWIVRQDAIGSRTLTLRSRFRSSGGVCPLTAMPGATDLIEGWSDGTLVYVTSITQDVS